MSVADFGLAEGTGEGLALADGVVDFLECAFEDDIADGVAGDVEGVEDRDARGEECAEGSGEACDGGFGEDLTHDGEFELDDIHQAAAALALSDELHGEEHEEGEAEDHGPAVVFSDEGRRYP